MRRCGSSLKLTVLLSLTGSQLPWSCSSIDKSIATAQSSNGPQLTTFETAAMRKSTPKPTFSSAMKALSTVTLLSTASIASAANIPSNPSAPTIKLESSPSSFGVPHEGFLSYSIEFANINDFAGNNSHPNTYSNNLLNNLRDLQGEKPYIRVGGTTQGFYDFDVQQKEQIKKTFTPGWPGPDQPRYLTIGPSFFESFNTWADTKFIFGLNMNETDEGLANMKLTAKYACNGLSTHNIAYWEMANEPDL